MAQPQHQYPPRPFSPAQHTPSHPAPTGQSMPPAKRPRLDDQQSYGSSQVGNLSLPNQVFSSPYYGNQTSGSPNGHNYSNMNHNFSPAAPYNTNPNYNSINVTKSSTDSTTPMQTLHTAPSTPMGPPVKPESKNTDLNELGDVLFGVGVDLKEEEAALLRPKTNGAGQSQGVDTHARDGVIGNAHGRYPMLRDNHYSLNLPGGRDSFYGAGTFNQTSQPELSIEDLAEVERKRVARVQAEIRQYHLNKPFLQGGLLQHRLHQEAQKSHLRVSGEEQLLKPTQPTVAPVRLTISGPDHNEILRVVKGEPLLGLKSDLVDILTLVSLATEERLRLLVEDSASLAKGRRTGSHGVVPEDSRDLVRIEHGLTMMNGLPTPANSVTSSRDEPLKRSHEGFSDVSAKPSSSKQSLRSVNSITSALQRIAKDERRREEERIAKRQKRTQSAAEASRDVAISLSSPVPATAGEAAPDQPKKSALKAAKKAVTPASEAQALAASNKTMNLALNNIVGKKPSWMKKDSAPSNPYAAAKQSPAMGNGSTSSKSGATPSKDAAGNRPSKARSFGDFREDGEGGRGLQLRDLINVLEYDGKEKKALQLAYGKLERRGTLTSL